MNIANGGAGQKKIGKIRQHSSFTLGEIFFLVLRSSKSNESQQQVFVRKELGATFPSLYDFDLSKGLTIKIFQNNSTTLLDAIFAGSNIILLLLLMVRGEATTHKATID